MIYYNFKNTKKLKKVMIINENTTKIKSFSKIEVFKDESKTEAERLFILEVW